MLSNSTFIPDLAKLGQQAELLKALAHPVRLCIVEGLLLSGGCNVTHMQHCLDLPQSTVSQHLSRLKAAGIVKAERHGLEVHYQLIDPLAISVIKAVVALDQS